MSKQQVRNIRELSKTGSIACSQLSKANERFLRPLFETGVLSKKRQGRGLAIVIENTAAFKTFVQTYFPEGLELTENGDTSRSTAISYWRDSKLGRVEIEPVLMNAKNDFVLKRNSEVFAVGEITKLTGVASLLLDDKFENYWEFSGTMALVENLEVFVNWQKTKIPADIAVWTAGKMSHRFLKWLKSSKMEKCKIIHCGDYDPVGLAEFHRLHKQVSNKISLYIPQDIESLFRKYSKISLLQNKSSANLLGRLRGNKHSDIKRIVKLIDVFNGGLEQEILLKN